MNEQDMEPMSDAEWNELMREELRLRMWEDGMAVQQEMNEARKQDE